MVDPVVFEFVLLVVRARFGIVDDEQMICPAQFLDDPQLNRLSDTKKRNTVSATEGCSATSI